MAFGTEPKIGQVSGLGQPDEDRSALASSPDAQTWIIAMRPLGEDGRWGSEQDGASRVILA
jgi:hypothetical protein